MAPLAFLTTLAAAIFASSAGAHLILKQPPPFGGPYLENSPLLNTGANFPCKYDGKASFWDRTGIETVVAIGQKSPLSFKGSAVHGGGSCQLAITADKAPTASSTWQVILSLEGGCPTKTGTGGPSTYEWQIPQGVSPGQYVFAWIWISKIAGQPEYYMNCAPITVTGTASSSKTSNSTNQRRSVDGAEDFDAGLLPRDVSLPNLFVANLASINSCKTTPGTDPVFPDPGPNVVVQTANKNQFAPVAGSNCVPKGATQAGTASGTPATAGDGADNVDSADSASSSSSSDSGSGSGNSGQYQGGSGSGSGTGSSSGSGNSGQYQGGDSGSGNSGQYNPGSGGNNGQWTPSPSVATVPTTTTIALPTSPSSTLTTSVLATVVPIAASSAAAMPSMGMGSGSGSGSGASSPVPSGASNSGASSGGQSGSCSVEGQWNCISGTSFQRCASGTWSAVQPVAPGTQCQPGLSDSITITRRSLMLFGRQHMAQNFRRWLQ